MSLRGSSDPWEGLGLHREPPTLPRGGSRHPQPWPLHTRQQVLSRLAGVYSGAEERLLVESKWVSRGLRRKQGVGPRAVLVLERGCRPRLQSRMGLNPPVSPGAGGPLTHEHKSRKKPT